MSPEHTVWLAVTIVRILLPFSIPRWPLAGAILCIVADTYDHTIFRSTGFGPYGPYGYQFWDKLLDTWYLTMLLVASRAWTDMLARRTAVWLYAWRLAGVIALETTGWRPVLVFAPNVLENFYLLWIMSLRWFPFRLTTRRLVGILAVLGLSKVYLEAHLHLLHPDEDFWLPFRHFLFGRWVS